MNNWIKSSFVLIAAASLVNASIAQSTNTKPKKAATEEIIIRQKGERNEKTTIVIDGDQVTVNGKPMADFKSDGLTVQKVKRPERAMAPLFQNVNVNLDNWNTPRAMLGVTTEKADDGAKILSVTKGSGAEKAGLKKDDIITKIGNTAIVKAEDLSEAVGRQEPKDTVEITYKRDGKDSKVSAVLGTASVSVYNLNVESLKSMGPNNAMAQRNFDMTERNFERPQRPMLNGFSWSSKPKIGMQIQDLEEGNGVKVTEVDEESPAAKAGLKEGDIITQLNGKELVGVDDLRDNIKDIKEGESFKLNYKRGANAQTAEVKIPKRVKTADL